MRCQATFCPNLVVPASRLITAGHRRRLTAFLGGMKTAGPHRASFLRSPIYSERTLTRDGLRSCGRGQSVAPCPPARGTKDSQRQDHPREQKAVAREKKGALRSSLPHPAPHVPDQVGHLRPPCAPVRDKIRTQVDSCPCLCIDVERGDGSRLRVGSKKIGGGGEKEVGVLEEEGSLGKGESGCRLTAPAAAPHWCATGVLPHGSGVCPRPVTPEG